MPVEEGEGEREGEGGQLSLERDREDKEGRAHLDLDVDERLAVDLDLGRGLDVVAQAIAVDLRRAKEGRRRRGKSQFGKVVEKGRATTTTTTHLLGGGPLLLERLVLGELVQLLELVEVRDPVLAAERLGDEGRERRVALRRRRSDAARTADEIRRRCG
mgnify:CR=1 FL=1